MNYAAMLTAERGDRAYIEQLRVITKNAITCLKDNRPVDTGELWAFLKEHPNYDCSKFYNYLGTKLNIIQLSVVANDIDLCKYLISERKAGPISLNVNYACRKGYTEVVDLLIRNYKEPKEEDITLWKQTAILNGHHNIAYLIDRLLNRLYIQFSKSNTDYFIRVINTSLKYTPENAYMENPLKCRPKKIILNEMLESLTKYGYMPYTLEYLNALKKIVKESISIYKLFHLGAEDIINTAINYCIPYKDGLKETNQRTSTGALLVVV